MKSTTALTLALSTFQVASAADVPIHLDYVTVQPQELGQLFLNVTVSENQTTFRDGDRELVIDYANLEVMRIDPDLGDPRVYRLIDPNDPRPPEDVPGAFATDTGPGPQGDDRQPQQGVPIEEQLQAILDRPGAPSPLPAGVDLDALANREIAAAISRYEIKSESAGAPVGGYAVSAKTVWFGRGFLNSRIVGNLHYPMWGRRFTERRVKFWVTKDHADYRAIDELAASRTPILRANPMLAHVDWTLLIPELGGLPVALEERGRDMLMRIELLTPTKTDTRRHAPEHDQPLADKPPQ